MLSRHFYLWHSVFIKCSYNMYSLSEFMLGEHQVTSCFILFLVSQKRSWILLPVGWKLANSATNKWNISSLSWFISTSISSPNISPLLHCFPQLLWLFFFYWTFYCFSISPFSIPVHPTIRVVTLLEPIPAAFGQRRGHAHISSVSVAQNWTRNANLTNEGFPTTKDWAEETCPKKKNAGQEKNGSGGEDAVKLTQPESD